LKSKSIHTPSVHRSGCRTAALTLFALLIIFLSGAAAPCLGYELKSRYAVISYENPKDLKKFNKELYVGGRLRSKVNRYKADTIEEEVIAKINVITEKAMQALDMHPRPLNYSIHILPNTRAVAKAFKEVYNVDVDYIAFFSPRLNRIFYSANNGRLRVTCHEIGHVIVENYFKISPPQRIHEVMAQYVEKHIND